MDIHMCGVCKKQFNDISTFLVHKRSHNGYGSSIQLTSRYQDTQVSSLSQSTAFSGSSHGVLNSAHNGQSQCVSSKNVRLRGDGVKTHVNSIKNIDNNVNTGYQLTPYEFSSPFSSNCSTPSNDGTFLLDHDVNKKLDQDIIQNDKSSSHNIVAKRVQEPALVNNDNHLSGISKSKRKTPHEIADIDNNLVNINEDNNIHKRKSIHDTLQRNSHRSGITGDGINVLKDNRSFVKHISEGRNFREPSQITNAIDNSSVIYGFQRITNETHNNVNLYEPISSNIHVTNQTSSVVSSYNSANITAKNSQPFPSINCFSRSISRQTSSVEGHFNYPNMVEKNCLSVRPNDGFSAPVINHTSTNDNQQEVDSAAAKNFNIQNVQSSHISTSNPNHIPKSFTTDNHVNQYNDEVLVFPLKPTNELSDQGTLLGTAPIPVSEPIPAPAYRQAINILRTKDIPSKKRPQLACSQNGCNFFAKCKEDLDQHARGHSQSRKYVCGQCQKAFTRNDKLTVHIRIHTNYKPYSCKICPYTCRERSSLKKHDRTHTNERPYKCQLCSYASRNSNHLTVHLRSHTGDAPYRCTVCDSKFKINTDLRRHMRTHSGVKPFKCDKCSYSATVKCNLQIHMRLIHDGERQVKCAHENCDFWTSSKKVLKEHSKVHGRHESLTCTQCSYICGSKSSLKAHQKVHLPGKPFKCTICSFSSKFDGNIVKHMQTVHKQNKNCKRKMKRETKVTKLTETTRRKNNVRNQTVLRLCNKSYDCIYEGCNEKFVRQDALRSHLKHHVAAGTLANLASDMLSNKKNNNDTLDSSGNPADVQVVSNDLPGSNVYADSMNKHGTDVSASQLDVSSLIYRTVTAELFALGGQQTAVQSEIRKGESHKNLFGIEQTRGNSKLKAYHTQKYITKSVTDISETEINIRDKGNVSQIDPDVSRRSQLRDKTPSYNKGIKSQSSEVGYVSKRVDVEPVDDNDMEDVVFDSDDIEVDLLNSNSERLNNHDVVGSHVFSHNVTTQKPPNSDVASSRLSNLRFVDKNFVKRQSEFPSLYVQRTELHTSNHFHKGVPQSDVCFDRASEDRQDLEQHLSQNQSYVDYNSESAVQQQFKCISTNQNNLFNSELQADNTTAYLVEQTVANDYGNDPLVTNLDEQQILNDQQSPEANSVVLTPGYQICQIPQVLYSFPNDSTGSLPLLTQQSDGTLAVVNTVIQQPLIAMEQPLVNGSVANGGLMYTFDKPAVQNPVTYVNEQLIDVTPEPKDQNSQVVYTFPTQSSNNISCLKEITKNMTGYHLAEESVCDSGTSQKDIPGVTYLIQPQFLNSNVAINDINS